MDLELGTRRARAAALLYLALPGGAYLYQGEELGLWEVEDIPDELRAGPDVAPHRRRATRAATAAGCRCPGPGETPPFGFSRRRTPTPSPGCRRSPRPGAGYTVEAQQRRPGLDARALPQRPARCAAPEPGLAQRARAAALAGVRASGVLAFRRGDEAACVVNLSAEPVALPAHEAVLLTSGPLTDDGLLPPDCAAWLRVTGDPTMS